MLDSFREELLNVRSETRKRFGLLRVLLCGVAVLGATVAVCVAQRYSFSKLSQGLGNLNVNCIAQDQTGYLWVGTENGLYRYDGSQFREFGAAQGMRGRTIQSLFDAPDGTLFVGTTAGIYYERQDGSFAEVHAPAGVGQFFQRIGTVLTATSKDYVVAADRSGAYQLRRQSGGWTAEPLHLDGEQIWSVLYGPDGALWYGCGSDLCRLKNGRTTHLGAALNLPTDKWLHMQFARDGHLWIRGAVHTGEVIPGEMRFEAHELPGPGNEAPYAALAEDAQGHMIALQGPEFGLWEAGHWRMVGEQNGLSHYDLSALFVDHEGSMWLGAVGHGLLRWIGQDHWEAYTSIEGLSNDIVWASLRDQVGRVWIGTESGLNYIPPGGDHALAWQRNGIRTERAASLAEDVDGSVWMGSAADKLVRIDEKTLGGRQWKVPEVYRVLSDGAHHVWVATDGGLYVVDTATKELAPLHVTDAGIRQPGKRFTDLCLDGAGNLWAASDDGLYRMDGIGWHRIDPGLADVNPYQIAADAKGNLWATGEFAGVMRLRIQRDKVVESEHIMRPQLLSEQVVSLAVDHRGWLWLGQDAGLTVYDGHAWRSYTQNDGLIWNDADAYALAEDRNGSMWIGTSGGISHLIAPESLPEGPPPAPVFPQLQFGATNLRDGESIQWSASPLRVTMAVPGFREASHIQIRYRMVGLEPDWVTTEQKSLRYPRLEPGQYELQAFAINDSSGESSAVATIHFRIVPRWWQNTLLRLALLLVLIAVAVMAWQMRVLRLVRQKRVLELAVQRRTEDLELEKTELLRAREQMRHYAEHDDLTGLWNHRIIIDRLRMEIDRAHRDGTPLSVILVDIDHFKQINDNFGHLAGDRVLREISAIFARSVRSYDWVGRYGGEEFLLILPGSSFDAAHARAEELRQAVESAHIAEGEIIIPVTASFGVASGFPLNYQTMVHAADVALYRAKDSGRNCVMSTEIDNMPARI